METHPIGVPTCPLCLKSFPRTCDLNKHSKSHSRPFKCTLLTCKYRTLGWPTRKELERHVNDKHAPTPRTYPCLFRPCPYRSKRLSNCKQHMEKVHGWAYVRSRPHGKTLSGCLKSEGSSLGSPSGALLGAVPDSRLGDSPGFLSFDGSRGDFILFPDHSDPSVNWEGKATPDSQTFIPWTSPSTRFQQNLTFLRRFTQTYLPSGDSAEADTLADPALSWDGSNVCQLSLEDADNPKLCSPKPAAETITRTDVPVGLHLSGDPGCGAGQSGLVASLPRQSKSGGKAGHSDPAPQGHATSISNADRSGMRGTADANEASCLTSLQSNDEDDHDGDRPRKRLKPSRVVEFKDTEMPDIFHAAYPRVYNRDNRPLYGSCHSTHKDISTLVRHLGRAPHKLVVHERYLSSFDVDVEYSHVKMGLCRRCWVCFSDREAFNRHISAECEKISKGKKEKWKILYDSFTPLVGSGAPGQPDSAIENQGVLPGSPAAPNQDREAARIPRKGLPNSPPASTTFPARVDPGPEAASQPPDDSAFVTMAEHSRLREEVRSIKRLVTAIIRQGGLGNGMASPLVASTGISPSPRPGIWPPASADEDIEGTNEEGLPDDQPDRASLVGHMNSQPTDVDPEGLIEEVEKTLSRATSGLSSGQFTVRHVTNSPPPRFRVHEVVNPASPRGGNAGDLHGHIHQQATSVPDSGYWSDKKRGSVGAADLAEQGRRTASRPTSPPPPPVPRYHELSTAEDNKLVTWQDGHDNNQWSGQVAGTSSSTSDPATFMARWAGVQVHGWDTNPFASSGPIYSGGYATDNDPFSAYGPGDGELQFHPNFDLNDHDFRPQE